ncbi:MAG TPA: DNA-binding domain-containing protein, partial [Terriglobales bacterium]|nr:DNA-binding domain-containing protein [Terriglobales bacterium]
QLLWKLIAAPEGAHQGLAELPQDERELARTFVRGDARLGSVERIDIYANMYFFRLLEVLRQDFPVTAAALGEARFHNLVTDYLLAHPPRHFSLRFVGAQLASFVATHSIRADQPYLPDLVAFEWARFDAFDAADAEPLAAEVLAQMPAERWPQLRFELTPSLRRLEVHGPIVALWERSQSSSSSSSVAAAAERAGPSCCRSFETGGADDGEADGPTRIRIWRRDFRVRHRITPADDAAALAVISADGTFAEVCELLIESCGEDQVAPRAVALLQQWLADGLLTAVR